MNIDNKIRADLFRNRIEDKNQLTGAGAIYVGTGIPKYISSTGAITGAPLTGTIGPFYETVGVAPTTGGQVPVSVMGTGSAEATGTVTGLAFKSVNDAMKGEDGNINLKTNGIFKVAGETDVNRPSLQLHTKQFDVEDLTNSRNIGIGNYIESGVSNSVTIGTSGSFGERCYTSVNSITLDSNFISGVSIYTAPSGTPKMSTTGGISVYATGTTERNLAPIIYNIGQRLDSLGFKELGNDVSFDFKLTYRPTNSTQFEIGTLTITPYQVGGNYCRATIDFKPKDVYRRKYPDVTYATATDDIDKVFLFYFSDYSTDYIKSQFTTNNMSSVNNISVFPAEDIYFEYAIPVELYTDTDSILKVGQTMMNLFFHLRPNSNGVGVDAEMFIRYQNYKNITSGFRASLESDWEGREEPIKIPTITYKRKV